VGLLDQPSRFHDNYHAAGRRTSTNAPIQCTLTLFASGTCLLDEVNRFNPMLDPSTSPLGQGHRSHFGIQVGGGTEQARYFLSASTEAEEGYLRMAGEDRRLLLEERGVSKLPTEQIRPNTLSSIRMRGNLGVNVGPRANVDVSATLVQGRFRRPNQTPFQYAAFGSGLGGSGAWLGGQTPASLFAVENSEEQLRFTGGLSGRWQVRPWLATRLNVGLDHSSARGAGLQRVGEGPLGANRTQGRRTVTRSATALLSGDMGATATALNDDRWLVRTSFGVQYNYRGFERVTATATGLPPGSAWVAGAAVTSGTEGLEETVVAGAFIEQTVGVRDKLFLSGAVRLDGASSFGRGMTMATYPKAGLSWLASREPWFPGKDWVETLRLRIAYGVAGLQPRPSDAIAIATPRSVVVDGSVVSGATRSSLGNPDLGPERQSEVELGFDVEAFRARLVISGTYYNQVSRDAIVARPLPASLGVGSRFENLGSVRNEGFELSATATVLERQQASLELLLSASTNDNKLLSLGEGVEAAAGSGIVVGYPLFGRWARPILGYEDRNGNGIIEADEVEIGEDPVFLGTTHPGYQVTSGATVWLAQQHIRLSALFEYRGDRIQYNLAEANRCTLRNCRGVNDPGASLREQAAAVAYAPPHRTIAGYFEDGSFLRWRELSVTLVAPPAVRGRIGASQASVTLAGRNLALWTPYRGLDPEINESPGLEAGGENPASPQTRYLTIRINLGF
jgi:hypothetical protein